MAMQKFYVGIKAAIVQDGKLLLVHNPKGFWDLPGGRMDDDENIEQTLRREVSEELPTAVNVRVGKIVHAHRKFKTTITDGTGLVLIIYTVDVDFPSGVAVSDEHDEFRWVELDRIVELETEFLTETAERLR